MRGVSTLIVAVLLTVIATSTAIIAYFWAMPRINLAFDLSETQSVQTALAQCDSKILETARTGSGNKCIIPAYRGQLTAQSDGLYYSLLGGEKLCDQTADWVSIDVGHHIEFSCAIIGKESMFNLRWRYPKLITISGSALGGSLSRNSEVLPIEFVEPTEFNTLSVFVYIVSEPGISGQNVDITRLEITQDNVTLGVRIY